MLVGREEELRRVTSLLDEARRGRSGTLVVVGEPGVGKTALLAEGRARSADMRVLAATGVESELELPFASLHELLRPVLGLLPRIPALQRQALAAALALEEGEPDAFVVGAGTLSLLVEAAEESAVLVALDDAHWLDRASADALAFAARRLLGEEIAFLAAVRPGLATPFDSLPRLDLGPLAPDDARRLLAHRAEPVTLADEARLLAAAAGNPLVLLELPVELARALPTSATSNERLRRAFSRRVEELSEAAQFGLLLAAAEPDIQTVRLASALSSLTPPRPGRGSRPRSDRGRSDRLSASGPAVARLLRRDRRRAPEGASGPGRRLLRDEDLDRRAWHRAAAAEDVDEEIAAALEQTAERAGARGGHAAEARALERAARLSPRKQDVARRLAAAVRRANWAGNTAHSSELAEEALRLTDDPLVRADLLLYLESLANWRAEPFREDRLLEAVDAGGLDSDRVANLLNLVSKKRGRPVGRHRCGCACINPGAARAQSGRVVGAESSRRRGGCLPARRRSRPRG